MSSVQLNVRWIQYRYKHQTVDVMARSSNAYLFFMAILRYIAFLVVLLINYREYIFMFRAQKFHKLHL